MPPASSLCAGEKFQRLVEIMARLRAPGGCPWDREQTYDSIKPFTLEETYEVMDAIDRRDFHNLAEELGDLTLQVVFYAQMAAEEGRFTVSDALDAINEKLIRRHPHVFGTGDEKTPDEVLQRWDEIKKQEKLDKGQQPKGLLDSVLHSQPALAEATQISRKAAAAGFDWPDIDQVLDKVREELAELAEARSSGVQAEVEGEVGDLLFTLVNVARFLKVDPEQALRKTNNKFRSRFGHVERELAARGRGLAQSNLEEMESLWQQAKSNATSNSAT